MWLNYLDKNPEIIRINQNCVQLDLDEKIKAKIDKMYIEKLDEIKKIKRNFY